MTADSEDGGCRWVEAESMCGDEVAVTLNVTPTTGHGPKTPLHVCEAHYETAAAADDLTIVDERPPPGAEERHDQ